MDTRTGPTDPPRYSSAWLALRENADADARATELVDALRTYLRAASPLVVRDVGCGTGSMGRWLAPRLDGPQHWIHEDRDTDLLAYADAHVATTAADGSPVTHETRTGDLTDLTAAALAGTSLLTASALLDILTAAEVDALAAACVGAGVPALLTMTVEGGATLDPADPLDADLDGGFTAHLRADHDGGRVPLGAGAVDATAAAFTRHGATVRVADSPWRLDARHAALQTEWLRGWVPSAARRFDPVDQSTVDAYLRRRLDEAATGRLRITIRHRDLLAVPS